MMKHSKMIAGLIALAIAADFPALANTQTASAAQKKGAAPAAVDCENIDICTCTTTADPSWYYDMTGGTNNCTGTTDDWWYGGTNNCMWWEYGGTTDDWWYGGTNNDVTGECVTGTTTTTASHPTNPLYAGWQDVYEDGTFRFGAETDDFYDAENLVLREVKGDEHTVRVPSWVTSWRYVKNEYPDYDEYYYPEGYDDDYNYIDAHIVGVEYDGTSVKKGEGTRQRALILPTTVSWLKLYDFSSDSEAEDNPENYYDLFTYIMFRNLECEINIPQIDRIKELLAEDGLELTICGFEGSTAEAYAEEHGLNFVYADRVIDGIRYRLYDDHASVLDWDWNSENDFKEIRIPETVEGRPVTVIEEGAFAYMDEMESIVIPDTVTEIGAFAFNGCNYLEKINIPDSVTRIGAQAFYGTALEKVTLPKNLELLGDGAFQESKLKELVIPDSITAIPNSLCSYSNLEKLTLPKSFTRIGAQAFEGCFIDSFEIPDGCTEIGYNAFSNCDNLTKIVMPDSVTELGEEAFWDCQNLAEVRLSENLKKIEACTFEGCTALKHIVIPESVSWIGIQAFSKEAFADEDETGIESIVILNKDCEFEDAITDAYPEITGHAGSAAQTYAAEHYCTFVPLGGGEAIQPDFSIHLTFEIRDGQAWVTGLNTEFSAPRIVIPAEYDGCPVVGIADRAFQYETHLLSAVLPDTITEIGEEAFNACFSLKEINLPKNLKTIGAEAFSFTKITSVKIPDGVTEIPYGAFENCSALTSVKLPKNLTYIGSYAFECCPFTEITFPNKLEKIESDAFLRSGLKHAVLPESVEHIGIGAFYSDSIESVTIPNADCGVEEFIGDNIPNSNFQRLNEEFVIYGVQDSEAHSYADWCGVPFYNLDGERITKPASKEYEPSDTYKIGYAAVEPTVEPTTDITTAWCGETYETTTFAEGTAPIADESTGCMSGTTYTCWWPETTSMACTTSMGCYMETTTTYSCQWPETTTVQTCWWPEDTTSLGCCTGTTSYETEVEPVPIAPQYSNDALCEMAVKDYMSKTGKKNITAAAEEQDGEVVIKLTDANGKNVDTYTVDPASGEGTASDGSAVNLPQTGNNSAGTAAAAAAALLLTLLGAGAMANARVLRKKEDEEA